MLRSACVFPLFRLRRATSHVTAVCQYYIARENLAVGSRGAAAQISRLASWPAFRGSVIRAYRRSPSVF